MGDFRQLYVDKVDEKNKADARNVTTVPLWESKIGVSMPKYYQSLN
jgi:hypothetical protein